MPQKYWLQQAGADERRNTAVYAQYALPRVARVAAEQLISAVAGKHGIDAGVLRHLRAEVCRNHRGIPERLMAEDRGDLPGYFVPRRPGLRSIRDGRR